MPLTLRETDSPAERRSVMARSPYSIVIPVYNERGSIGAIIEEIRRDYPLCELIIVDDGSTDGTSALLDSREPNGVVIVRHARNRGYGAALKTGIRRASCEVIITMDADGQHPVSQIHALLGRLDGSEMVVGVRPPFGHSPWWRLPGKWALGALTSYLARRRIPDVNSGLRAFRREAMLPYLPMLSDGFSFSTTSLLAMFHAGHRVEFVPVHAQKRKGTSTVTLKTGLDAVILVLRIIAFFDPLRLFLPLSGLLALLGIGWGSIYVFLGRGVSVGALLFLLTSVLLFCVGLLMDQIAAVRKSLLELSGAQARWPAER